MVGFELTTGMGFQLLQLLFYLFLSAFGLSECSVAAPLLLEFLLARVGNLLGRFLSSRAASGIGVAPPDELGGLQHLSLQSALILSSSICVNNVSETM